MSLLNNEVENINLAGLEEDELLSALGIDTASKEFEEFADFIGLTGDKGKKKLIDFTNALAKSTQQIQ